MPDDQGGPPPSLGQVREVLEEIFSETPALEDPGWNGVQVAPDDWERPCRLLATGVTSSQRFLRQALGQGADLCLVHHGLFWRSDGRAVEGMLRERLRILLGAGAALAAWHLPLDIHPKVGNNLCLGRELGFRKVAEAGRGGLLYRGELAQPMGLEGLARLVEGRLGRPVLRVEAGPAPVRSLAWCTGAGQGFIEDAARLGADAFLSGEISEQTTHAARELGIHYLACGHHATERYGVQAAGAMAARRLKERGLELRHRFFEDPNPA